MAEETPPGSNHDAIGAKPYEPDRSVSEPHVPGNEVDPLAKEVKTVVSTLLELIGIRARVEVEVSRGECYVGIKPQISRGLLIGKQGNTLQSLQYITRLIIKRRFPDGPPVILDVGGYRWRREQALCQKAEAVARIVIETKREMALDPMTEKERMLVEERLRKIPEVRVYSVGQGQKQNVIVAPKQR